jgi:HD-like signal output (HDOD) protein/ActR/RegA family two-component response regulator
MKKQILFVDDENNILEGLRRILHPLRDDWDIQFAISGAQALEIIETQPIDVIITDMRMPEMDGVELLHEVMKRRPGIVRIVFSGQADSNLTMKAVEVAHQFINKPCEPEILKTIVHRALSLRALLSDSSLMNVISEMDTIPSVPALYHEISNELQSADPSIKKVGNIIARDPGMTAKILQLVNSPFFALRRSVSNTVEAIAYLGLDRIQHLFLAFHAFAQFAPPKNSSFSIERLWAHSLSVAITAKQIAMEEEAGRGVAEESFTVGLLHDIGKLVLASKFADKHAEAARIAKKDIIPLWEAEMQVFSVTHSEVGAYLLGLWGLPDSIVEATAYSHRPMDAPNSSFCALTALHAADCQIRNQCYTEIPLPKPDLSYLSGLLRKTLKDFKDTASNV